MVLPHTNASSQVSSDNPVPQVVSSIAAYNDSTNLSSLFSTVCTTTTIFFTPITYTTGASTAPYQSVVGDFNGDGKLDLATVDISSNSVSVLLGNGDGTFKAPVLYTVDTSPNSVTAVDLNGDGKLDLVTSNFSGQTVTVLLGNGDGTFKTSVNYGAGVSNPAYVAAGDFNGDGKPDLVIQSNSSPSVGILLNKGDGTFSTSIPNSMAGKGSWVGVGDVNGDGKLDVVSNGGGAISVLLGKGDGTFQPFTASQVGSLNYTRSMILVDLNGDGKLDVVANNSSANTVMIFKGNGNGTFQSSISYPVGTTSTGVAVGDLNGDNKLDLVVSNAGSNNVSVLAGNGDGTFQIVNSYSVNSSNPYGVTVADLNGDGRPDIVTANSYGANSVSILLSQVPTVSSLRLTAPATVIAGVPFTDTVTALDGCGNVASNYTDTVKFTSTDSLGVLPGNYTFSKSDAGMHVFNTTLNTLGVQVITVTDTIYPSLFSSANITVTAGPASYIIASGGNNQTTSVNSTFTAPLKATVFGSSNKLASGIVVTFTLSTGSSQTLPSGSFTGGSSVFTGITGSDGSITTPIMKANSVPGVYTVTAIAAGVITPTIFYLENLSLCASYFGSSSALTYTTGASTAPYQSVAGDFNGDGKLDLATANSDGNSVSVLLGNGDGTFKAPVLYAVDSRPIAITAVDLNGDGKVDLVTSNFIGQSVSVLLGNGDGTFKTSVNYGAGVYNPAYVATGDFNGDGKPDLAVQGNGSPSVGILLNKGDGTFGTATLNTVTGPGSWLVTGDVNGDGKMDVVSDGGGTINILLSKGDGTFQPFTTSQINNLSYTRSIALVDLNGDGKLDLVANNSSANTVMIFKGNGNGTFQSSVSYPVGTTSTGVAVGDLNGDNKLDLVVSNAGNGSVSVLLGNGDGTFGTTSNYSVNSSNPYGVTVTDLNGDGRLDIVSANSYGANNISVLLNQAVVSSLKLGVPNGVTAGVPFTDTVTALDACGNVATNYTGTVKFASTDSLGVLPNNYTFSKSDAGVHVFSTTLNTSGGQLITVTDTLNSLLISSGSLTVTSNFLAGSIKVSGNSTPQDTQVNTAFSIPLQATILDANNNPASGIVVTFSIKKAPGSNAAATFAGNTTTTSATTNVNGIASVPAPTADSNIGSYTVVASVSDIATPAIFTLSNYSVLPPNPVIIAPPIVGLPPISDTVQFLYTGSNLVQSGVAPGTIQPNQVAVVRGRVLHSNGNPAPGISITIYGHPEFGSTLSRADGRFDMVVNGGGLLTVNYQQAGYISAQRQVAVAQQDYNVVPDVVLLNYDTQVTQVSMGGSQTQVVQGSLSIDSSGSRQATLLFPPGTTATITATDGTTQALNGPVHIRATEYTVGANGPNAMPGTLPATSGYTYAAEFSIDEAVAAKASGVSFNQPVVAYVQNFLHFAVGTPVPSGYYNMQSNQWVASSDGRVIKILSVTNGSASVDISGTNTAAEPTALATLGITAAEQQTLANLYPAGTVLWRVNINHFSAWDFNLPYAPRPGAISPNLPGPITPANDQALAQDLDQSVGIVGSTYQLHYKSGQVSGNTANASFDLPIISTTVPAGIKRVDVQVEVAGQVLTYSVPITNLTPNQTQKVSWDGLDAYGRPIQNTETAHIGIGYVYDGLYLTPDQQSNSTSYYATFGHYSYYGTPATGDATRQEVTLWQYQDVQLKISDARSVGLGAWTIDIQHRYDATQHVLYMGDGTHRESKGFASVVSSSSSNLGYDSHGYVSLQALANGGYLIADSTTLKQVSPTGTITQLTGSDPSAGYQDCASGTPYSASISAFAFNGGGVGNLFQAHAVVQAPDGTIYIAETYSRNGSGPCVWKLKNGIVTSYAGNGNVGYSGDGGPATSAQLGYAVNGIALGPDGSLYIVDSYNSCIRKVSNDGIITTVAGNYIKGAGYSGDGGMANQAQLNKPRSVSVGPDGSLYIADYFNHVIRKVLPSGIITTVAGNYAKGSGYSGDGGPATEAQLSDPNDVLAQADGSFYLVDYYNYVIRQVTSDGNIKTVAGNGTGLYNGVSYHAVSGSIATNSPMEPQMLTSIPGGNISFSEMYGGPIQQLSPSPLGANGSASANVAVVVPSADGNQYYNFDSVGKHLSTVNALTGQTIYTFGYDSASRLSQITDAYNNITTIQHDDTSRLITITAPYGQTTILSFDANGFASSIADPSNYSYQFTYTNNGLMTGMLDPRGGQYQYTYDPNGSGRLIKSQNPLGGIISYSRVADPTNPVYTVTVQSEEGRTITYKTEGLADGSTRNTKIDANGQATVEVVKANGTRVTTAPNGIVTVNTIAADQRWGMQAPLESSQLVETSASRPLSKSSLTRTEIVATPDQPLSQLQKQTTVTTLFDQIYTSTFTFGGPNNTSTISTTGTVGAQTLTTVDANGHPIQQQTIGLAPTSYTYDNSGRPLTTVHGTGAQAITTTYHYNSAGLVDYNIATFATLISTTANITTPTTVSYCTNYQYNASSWLIAQTDPYLQSTNSNGCDATNQPGLSYEYDQMGHVITTTNQLGQQSYKHYDAVSNLTSLVTAQGQQTLYGYDKLNRLITTTLVMSGQPNLVTLNQYDTVGNLISRTDPNKITTSYTYDIYSRLLTTTLPLQVGGAKITENSYNDASQLASVTNYNTGGANETTSYQYDNKGRLVTTTLPYGYQSLNVYDDNDDIIATKASKFPNPTLADWNDPSKVVTSATTYDNLKRMLTTQVNAWSATTGDNLLTTNYTYDDFWHIQTATDPQGIINIKQSDAAGQAISGTVIPATSNIVAGAQPQSVYNFYDPSGMLVLAIDAANNWIDTGYDLLHRTTSFTRYTGTARAGTPLTTQTRYTDQAQPVITSIGPAPYLAQQSMTRDEAGRNTSMTIYTRPNLTGGLTTHYTYDGDGNLLTRTDPDPTGQGHLTNYSYENTGALLAVNQIVTTKNLANNQSSLQTLVTTYNYDLLGNLLYTNDAAGHSTTNTYDLLNRLVVAQDALGHATNTSYDGLGRPITYTDTLNQQSVYSYDNASRLLQTASYNSGSSTPALNTRFSYNSAGKPTIITDTLGGITSFSYDGLNRVKSVNNHNGLVQYSYDILGRRTQLDFGANATKLKTVSYQYDSLNRPQQITNWANQTMLYSYTGAQLTGLTYPNGVNAAYTYDTAGRLTDITHTQGINNIIFAQDYSLDNLGNRTVIDERTNGTHRTLTYGYDELNRLTTEKTHLYNTSTDIVSSYSYDAVGNRLQMQTNSPIGVDTISSVYTYDAADRLSTINNSTSTIPNLSSTNFSYDNNSSMQTETYTNSLDTTKNYTTNYTFDVRNRLINWQKTGAGAAGATFRYDGGNTRINMTYSGPKGNYNLAYLQDIASQAGLPLVLQEFDASGQTLPSDYLYLPGSTSPIYQTNEVTGVNSWYHADGIGSVRLMTDGVNGSTIQNNYDYDAFGNSSTTNETTSNSHTFSGEQIDPTGLSYNRARYYNPAIGRFISRDTFGGSPNNPLSMNRFIYAANNPAGKADHNGHDPNSDAGGGDSSWGGDSGSSGDDGGGLFGAVGQLVSDASDVITDVAIAGDLIAHGGDVDATSKDFTNLLNEHPDLKTPFVHAAQIGSNGAVQEVSQYSNNIPIFGNAKMITEGLAHERVFGPKLSDDEANQELLMGGIGLALDVHGINAAAKPLVTGEREVYQITENIETKEAIAVTEEKVIAAPKTDLQIAVKAEDAHPVLSGGEADAIHSDSSSLVSQPHVAVSSGDVHAQDVPPSTGGGHITDDDGYTLVGYHGTSDIFLPGFQENGIKYDEDFQGKNSANGYQIGPGFYTTPDVDTALDFSIRAKKKQGGDMIVMEIWARDFENMAGRNIPERYWDGASNTKSRFITNYDYLTSVIVGYEDLDVYQIKFNPRAFPALKIGKIYTDADIVPDLPDMIAFAKSVK
jgi:RHS repeat-associated protein